MYKTQVARTKWHEISATILHTVWNGKKWYFRIILVLILAFCLTVTLFRYSCLVQDPQCIKEAVLIQSNNLPYPIEDFLASSFLFPEFWKKKQVGFQRQKPKPAVNSILPSAMGPSPSCA